MCAVLLLRRRRLGGGGRLRLQERNRAKADDRNDEEKFGAHEQQRRERTEWPSRYLPQDNWPFWLASVYRLSTAAVTLGTAKPPYCSANDRGVTFAPPVVRSAR